MLTITSLLLLMAAPAIAGKFGKQSSGRRPPRPAAARKVTRPRRADRGRQKKQATGRLAKRLAAARKARLGRGWFASVYRTPDGKSVIKIMRARVAGVWPVSAAKRKQMAALTVEMSEKLRAGGLPVPESAVVAEKPDRIAQGLVSEGQSFYSLYGEAKQNAMANRNELFRRAHEILGDGDGSYVLDTSEVNLRFDADGNVVAWIDPIAPLSSVELKQVEAALARAR